ncbi:nucleotidyltransferase family protein [Litoribacillus peritrichatus]|uniref:MobA-like NTP transferase domain-containing protein n=1 Tax=Litoribacillus peritrichatus TaxID=718191 RepID=A0ABP7M5X9_9GAMM
MSQPILSKNTGVLLLAAGQSKRFGSQKLMYPIKMDSQRPEKPMVGWTIENILSVTDQLVVVVDPTKSYLVEYLKKLNVDYVLNEQAEQGLGMSLSSGIQAVTDRWQTTMVALGDMPFIEPETYASLLSESRKNAITLPVVNLGGGDIRRGNPVVFGEQFYSALMGLNTDQGGKEIIHQHQDRVLEVDVPDQGVLRDIDQRSDLVNLMSA